MGLAGGLFAEDLAQKDEDAIPKLPLPRRLGTEQTDFGGWLQGAAMSRWQTLRSREARPH